MEDKKKDSPFQRCLDETKHKADKVISALEKVDICLSRNNIESAYIAAFRVADCSERLTNVARQLPAYTGHPKAHDMIENAMLESFPIQIGFTAEGWFCLKIPLLLPKKSSGSPAYITDPIYPAMKRFWRGKPPVRYPDNILIFRHVYSKERPERQYRDHDNIELNRVTDTVALYVMVDDSPTRCRHYYCSAPGSSERTEVYVVPRSEFSIWLSHEDSIPDTGVILYENLTKS